jgi:hypothetical protein
MMVDALMPMLLVFGGAIIDLMITALRTDCRSGGCRVFGSRCTCCSASAPSSFSDWWCGGSRVLSRAWCRRKGRVRSIIG